jgi:selT/selW/selH-like putative selenoprotein
VIKKEFKVDAQLEAGSGGVFDVFRDGQLLFSKADEGDFPEPQEIVRRITGRQKK